MHPCHPALSMHYLGLDSPIEAFFHHLRQELNTYPHPSVIPQIGLSMTTDGQPERHYEHLVAQGAYDDKIADLLRGLESLRRPVFLRIGYECNGFWNGYHPPAYVAAFRRIVAALRSCQLHDVASV